MKRYPRGPRRRDRRPRSLGTKRTRSRHETAGEEPLPTWVDNLPERPAVYAMMGTAFNRVERMLQAIVASLRDQPITLIPTTGRDQDLASFGPQPPNVHAVEKQPLFATG